MKLYEGMFLLDNNEVRNDWKAAKALVTGTLEKHGANVITARRWDERRLAYPIKKRNRATYLLCYFEADPSTSEILRRDFDLSEKILRYLILSAEAVPDEERELSQAELADDFSVPAPPEDDFLESEDEGAASEEPEASQGADETADETEDETEDEEAEVEPAEVTTGTKEA